MMQRITVRPGIAAKTEPMKTPRLIQMKFSTVNSIFIAGMIYWSIFCSSFLKFYVQTETECRPDEHGHSDGDRIVGPFFAAEIDKERNGAENCSQNKQIRDPADEISDKKDRQDHECLHLSQKIKGADLDRLFF